MILVVVRNTWRPRVGGHDEFDILFVDGSNSVLCFVITYLEPNPLRRTLLAIFSGRLLRIDEGTRMTR